MKLMKDMFITSKRLRWKKSNICDVTGYGPTLAMTHYQNAKDFCTMQNRGGDV